MLKIIILDIPMNMKQNNYTLYRPISFNQVILSFLTSSNKHTISLKSSSYSLIGSTTGSKE